MNKSKRLKNNEKVGKCWNIWNMVKVVNTYKKSTYVEKLEKFWNMVKKRWNNWNMVEKSKNIEIIEKYGKYFVKQKSINVKKVEI